MILRLTFLFFLLFTSHFSECQVSVRSSTAELYSRSQFSGNWILEKSNKDVDIPIILYENEILIEANNPSHYKFEKSSATEIKTDKLSGSRFIAVELYSRKFCTIEVANLNGTNFFVISIIYDNEGLNFRYFVNSDD